MPLLIGRISISAILGDIRSVVNSGTKSVDDSALSAGSSQPIQSSKDSKLNTWSFASSVLGRLQIGYSIVGDVRDAGDGTKLWIDSGEGRLMLYLDGDESHTFDDVFEIYYL
jgi:hypothetical protein